jgi:hypothetical protein
MKAGIGQDIESLCSKCGESWHVVIAMVEQKIVKVECKQCHAVHRHRDPKGKAAATAKAPRAAGAKPRSATGKKTSRGAARLRVEADLAKPVRPYSVTESFESGERVQHAKFGEGVVQQSTGPGKIEVLFGDDLKVLAQAKPASRRFSTP